MAEEGLQALTIAALEERLDCTRGVITYHFKDKDDIVASVLQSALEEIEIAMKAEVRASARPAERVRAVVESLVRGFIERREAGRILFSFWSRLGAEPALRRKNARLYQGYRRQAARLVRDCQPLGLAEASPEALGAVLVSVVLGLAVQDYFEPGSIDIDAAVSEATAAVLARLKIK